MNPVKKKLSILKIYQNITGDASQSKEINQETSASNAFGGGNAENDTEDLAAAAVEEKDDTTSQRIKCRLATQVEVTMASKLCNAAR